MTILFEGPQQDKTAELRHMKRLALLLLLAATVIYVVASVFEQQYAWVGYVVATAEAAMIGAIADWFAVTALFRHPLGLKIPHTAIIPTRKNVIAAQFGDFVQQNFLSEQIITERVASMNLSRRVAGWLSRPDNARAVAEQITTGLGGLVRVINDDDIQKLIEQRVEDRIRETSFAPMIGELLSFITSGRRQQELFDAAVGLGLRLLDDSDADIRTHVSAETPWWFPNSVDRAIYEKIVRSISRTLYEMQVDIYHPLRVRIVEAMNRFMHDLQHSADITDKEIALKQELLQAPAVREFTGSLWRDIKSALIQQSEHPSGELQDAIQETVMGFGHTILNDARLADKIDDWALDSARYLIRTFGDEIAELISNTIDNWDAEATSQKIELQIGKDLQFIRINGTVVGGLVGFSLYAITQALQSF